MQPDNDACTVPVPMLEDLMLRYQQADTGATEKLVDLLSPRLYRFFAAHLGNRSEASDMLQDTWLRIHRARHTYRAGAPLLPWVYAIAHRVRIDGHRRRTRTSREIGVDILPESPQIASSAGGDQPAFEEMLASLPESQREVLTMLKVLGLSIDEVAQATSSTSGAVKQKVHRAYEKLRGVLANPGVVAVRK